MSIWPTAAAVLVLAACTPVREEAVVTPKVEGAVPGALAGPEWEVFEVAGEPAPQVTMQFAAGRIFGKGGCNRYTGPVRFPGGDRREGAIEVGPVAMTMMACPEPAMAVEQRFAKALEQVQTYALAADGTLVLSGAEGPLLRARRAAT
ncbi:META domain-containing protein [Thermaurantiacus sp.]